MTEVFLPVPANQAKYAEILDALALPAELAAAFASVVEAMKAGQAVSVTALEVKLSTQQAVDFLGTSRRAFIDAAADQGVSFEMVGSHRRILLNDLLAMQTRMRAEQKRLLNETIAANVAAGVYELDAQMMPARA